MSLRRVAVLLSKELLRGPRNFMFIFAVVAPVLITLLVWLLFGTIFADAARLGLVDEGNSRLVGLAQGLDALTVKTYPSAAELEEAAANGRIDMGLVLPAGFDAAIIAGAPTEVAAFVWGESQMKHRVVVGTAVTRLMREIAGQAAPVEIVAVILGDGESISWEARLLPLIVLMSIILGGSMVPATSLVEEKQKRTLTALNVTPASLGEIFLAKGLLGMGLSLVMGLLILILNRAFGQAPGLLMLVLFLGAAMAAAIGVLLGAFIRDINTLFTVIKAAGILLYAPALIYLFPTIPQWIGRLFPTYYMIHPVVAIVQEGAGWADVAPELGVLVALILALVGVIAGVARRAPRAEGQLNPA